MRVFLAATLFAGLSPNVAIADTELSLSIGAMQRSYSENTVLLQNTFVGPILSSDDTETLGYSFQMDFEADDIWVRGMVYADRFSESIFTPSGGTFFDVAPAAFGITGLNTTADFTRETGLVRTDFLYRVRQFSGIDLYVGGSLAQISDTVGALLGAQGSPGLTATMQFDGSTDMIGAVVGAQYDHGSVAGIDGLTLSAAGTLGVFGAQHRSEYSLTSTGAGGLTHNSTASASETVGAAEIALSLAYGVTETTAISLTYQAAYYSSAINGAGLVPATTVNSPNSTTGIAIDSVLYQGLSLGYLMRF